MWEYQYLNLVSDILELGDDREDRTGTGTRALFGKTIDIDLKQGFPAMTTKKLAWKAVVSELLWFLEGSGDERRLAEILHGTRDPAKQTIWTSNSQADYWKPNAGFIGDLGRVYGVQWRSWFKYKQFSSHGDDNEVLTSPFSTVSEIDQIDELVKKLKTNPTDRRMIVSAWNPAEIDQMALPPCHMMFQCFVNKNGLSLQMYQRSVDTMLGLPFNIASYALLTHMLAQVAGLEVDRLILNLGDVHIYKNHLEGAQQQVERVPFDPPTLTLNHSIVDIDGFSMADIGLEDYQSQEAIKMEMAV